MLKDPDTNQRICEVCKKPFDRQYTRWDTKFCSPKCKQQAYRDRNTAKLEKYYADKRHERAKEQDRRDRYNANRKKARAKRRRTATKA